MNTALWILQLLFGSAFVMNGSGKVFCYQDAVWLKVQHIIPWIDGVSQNMFIFIGCCEFLGGAGLFLPALSKVKVRLSPLAAVGMATVMGLATGFHLLRHEYKFSLLTLVLAAIFAFIAYGRFVLTPLKGGSTPTSILVGLGALLWTVALVILEFSIEHHVGA